MFCIWQGKDDEGIYCTAEIASGRILCCPYEKKDNPKQSAEKNCVNFKEIISLCTD